ncbi:nucleoside monophosphate kinase [Pleurocapsales cyanobacterium LEGE 10410]|nr:nucleoside monophosphate kinase [Pleurocapsales cyanobacterium LEGE 10410]
MRLVILGGTGSGKGTQTARLSDRLKILSISMGDILREGIAAGTELGQQAETYVSKGELVPDSLMIQFVQQRLQQPDVSDGWILEGYPRTAFQAEELDFLLQKIKQKLDWAIYLKVSEAIMTERALGRGMADDRVEVIERRIQNFQEFTVPILEYYDYCQRLLTIDGEQSPDAVTQELMSKVS